MRKHGTKQIGPSPERVRLFVEEYCKSLNAVKAALAAGYAPTTARAKGNLILKDPRTQALLASRPAARLSGQAAYSRDQAAEQYDRIFEGALADQCWDKAKEVVDAKVALYGLAAAPPAADPAAVQPNLTQNNIYNIAGDDELYELLTRMREAGHGIDTESIGHEVAGLAEAKSKDRGQAKPASAAGP